MSTSRDAQLRDLQARAEDALSRVVELRSYLDGIGSIPADPLSSFQDAALGLHGATSSLRHFVLEVAHWRQNESDEARRLDAIRRGEKP